MSAQKICRFEGYSFEEREQFAEGFSVCSQVEQEQGVDDLITNQYNQSTKAFA